MIVLLILAAVSIATLTGENGLLAKVDNAKTETTIGEEKEAIGLAYNGAKTEKLGGEVTAEDLNNEFAKNGTNATASGSGTITVTFPSTERTYILSSNGSVEEYEPVVAGGTAKTTVKDNYTDGTNSATIPAGFTVSETENKISEGLVVTAPDGSEFVWVPASVGSMATKTSGQDENGKDNYQGKLYDFSGTGDSTTSEEKTSYGQGTTSYREPSLVTGKADTYAVMESITGSSYDAKSDYYNTILEYTSALEFGKDMQKDYNAMIESVSKYGGFYIGRYETSIAGETVASTKGNADTRLMASINWYNMYKKQKNYANANRIESVSSSMIWGSQWDAMLNWALTGSDKAKVTAKSNAPHNLDSTYQPGTETADKINNIFDLEGNVYEWTLEAYSTNSRVSRGRFLR